MNKLEFASKAVTAIVSVSVSRVIGQVIENNTSPTNVADKAALWIGSGVLGSVITSTAIDHVTTAFDGMVLAANERKNSTESNEEETTS